MAITFVGAGNVAAISTTAVTYAFSSLLAADGSTPTLQQGDLVVVTTTYRASSAVYDQTPSDPSSVAYTAAYANIAESNSNEVNFKTSYKFMGATPDASVTIPSSPGSSMGSATIHVFRGVDTGTPLDVTPTTSGTTGATIANAPPITPVTAGAWIYVAGGEASGAGTTSLTAPANIDTTTNSFQAPHSNQSNTAAGIYSGWTSGAFDPAAFGGYVPGTGGGAVAASIALRPASAGPANQTINAGLTTNTQTYYAEQLNLTLFDGLYTNSQSFYGPKLNLSVNPALATNNQSFYSFSVMQAGPQTVNAPLITNVSVTFGPNVQGFVPPDPRNMAFTVGRPLAGFHHQNPFGRFR